jgi:hypothetical protein
VLKEKSQFVYVSKDGTSSTHFLDLELSPWQQRCGSGGYLLLHDVRVTVQYESIVSVQLFIHIEQHNSLFISLSLDWRSVCFGKKEDLQV